MATCQHCGSEMTGMYCSVCGERAQAPVGAPAKKPARKVEHKDPETPAGQAEAPVQRAAPRPSARPVHRPRTTARGPSRVTRTTTMVLIAVAIFAAGVFTGTFLSANSGSLASGGTVTSTAEDLTGGSGAAQGDNLADPDSTLPPLAQADVLMDQGVQYLEKGSRSAAADKFRKSAAQFEKVTQSDPNNLYAQAYLGLVYFYIGDTDKAFTTERTLLDKDPNYLWAIFNLAWMYEATGKNAEAALTYHRYTQAAVTEQQNKAKYAEQFELIATQLETARSKAASLK